MAGQIDPGSTALADDFINAAEKDATPANDEGKVAKLETDGRFSYSFFPVGFEFMVGMNTTPPPGTLVRNGQAVSRTTYAELFAWYGTFYGAGDGSTTFNLPDDRGKVPVGYDASQTEFDTIGKIGGAKTVPHTHGSGLLTRVNGSLGSAGFDPGAHYAGLGTSTQPTDDNNLQPYRVKLPVVVY